MKYFFKFIWLQLFWFFAIYYNLFGYPSVGLYAIAFLTVFLNYHFFKPFISVRRYIVLTLLFCGWGVLQDYTLYKLEIISSESFPYWIGSLWIVFIAYYGDLFNKLKTSKWIQAILGAIGGTFAYVGGWRLGGLQVMSGQEYFFILVVFSSWFIFFPLSMFLFYSDKAWIFLSDINFINSFGKDGYQRRASSFQKLNLSLGGQTALVTGGTSGIGHEVVRNLHQRGCHVTLTGRTEPSWMATRDHNLNFLKLDMANWDEIESCVSSLEKLEYVVFNAGGMPEILQKNKQDIEYQMASQLFGHYYLLRALKRHHKIDSKTRIVWVSSGGMYLKKLNLSELESVKKYNKVSTYANVKRAQVTLVNYMSTIPEWKGFQQYTMHPGWVHTRGLSEALPSFTKYFFNQLRTPEMGADTILWLLLTEDRLNNGAFYFDRRQVSPVICGKMLPTEDEARILYEKINSFFEV